VTTSPISRRDFVVGTLGTGAALLAATQAEGANRSAIYKQIEQRHDESVARLQEWLHQPSIAAENKGMQEGCEMMRKLALDAGFQNAECIQTTGHPGVFATLDAGARNTLALYFMYDVKQVDPSEWSSPPWEAQLVDKPRYGKCVVARGAVNQKGPQAAFLAALHAIRGAGRKLPVNLVLVAEGEEEIGSPSFPQIVLAPKVRSALSKSVGVFMPDAAQESDGTITITLGSKGDIECDLIASGEKWGRGPTHDVHSSYAARMDQPAWRLVQALNTLVTPTGDPAVDGFFDKVKPLTAAEKAMLDVAAQRIDEVAAKEAASVKVWARDANWRQALEDAVSRPTMTIEGLVGGYTGPGGKTILPHRMVAKLDMRLVPDMTGEETLAKLKAHLAKRGYGDIQVVVNGGMNETSTTSADSLMVRAQRTVYKNAGIDAMLWPRSGGSWPGSVFTGEPLKLAAGHFGLGYGDGAHAPDEFYIIESKNPKLFGIDDATKSFVDFLYAVA
jgi:acetylornithine deacetylase/succinyl-diaminopimelate desuccinylase-like protein